VVSYIFKEPKFFEISNNFVIGGSLLSKPPLLSGGWYYREASDMLCSKETPAFNQKHIINFVSDVSKNFCSSKICRGVYGANHSKIANN